jgi:tRNA dimethylallyltransferase
MTRADETPRVLVLAGPTASGKTGAAVELALRLGGELVGADSVQVYRGFDVGSAKPTSEELRGVRHHLIDAASAGAPLDAMAYARLADAAIADVLARGRLPIVVGGTGLWLRALVRGLVAVPPVDPALRARLDGEAARVGAPALHARLTQVDPLAAAKIHPNDQLRIVRALEVFEQTGTPLGALHAEHALGGPRYPLRMIALDRPTPELHARIELRVRAMLAGGFADEVRALVTVHGEGARPLQSVGYREMLEHVLRGVSLEETTMRILQSTKTYARQQRTWLKNEPGIDWRAHPDALLGPEGARLLEAFARSAPFGDSTLVTKGLRAK